MTQEICSGVRERLPEWLGGALPEGDAARIREHLEACPGCREEVELLKALLDARPAPPPGLEDRIRARLREAPPAPEGGLRSWWRRPVSLPFPERWIPAWALPAAAVLVLALGSVLVLDARRNAPAGEEGPEVAALEPLPDSWLWQDGIVAGSPTLDGLSEEALEQLLKELGG